MWLGKIGLAKTAIGKNGHWQKWIGKFGREPSFPTQRLLSLDAVIRNSEVILQSISFVRFDHRVPR